MTNPDPTPPRLQPAASPANILDYQRTLRARKAFRTASGGLILMAGFLLIVGILVGSLGIKEFISDRGRTPLESLLILFTGLLPILWTSFYLLVAILFQRRYVWAGWTAFILSIIHFIFPCWALVAYLVDWLGSHYKNELGLRIVGAILFLAVIVGFGAVIFEVWRALRNPNAWRYAGLEEK